MFNQFLTRLSFISLLLSSSFAWAGEPIPAFYAPAPVITATTTLHPDIQNTVLNTCLFRCYAAEANCLQNIDMENEELYNACVKQTNVCRRDCTANSASGRPIPAGFTTPAPTK